MIPAMLIAALLGGGVGSAPGLEFQKAGVKIGRATKFNFTGTAVGTCSQTGTTATCALTAGAGGSGNTLQATLDFGNTTGEGDTASLVITGQAWVTGTSIIICVPDNTVGTVEHPAGDDDVILAGLSAAPSALVVGTGFTLSAYATEGTYGRFVFNCSGT